MLLYLCYTIHKLFTLFYAFLLFYMYSINRLFKEYLKLLNRLYDIT